MRTNLLRRLALSVCAACLLGVLAPFASAAEPSPDAIYTLGADSQPHEGVPKGTVTKYSFNNSKVYPDTFRDYWVYVPSQYKPDQPAALMVFLDGIWYQDPKASVRVPFVFDNLIHKGEMPVTIGVFVNPGAHKDKQPADGKWKSDNRSFEYDTLHDLTARMLIEEILPEVAKTVKFTDDPEGHAICGMSSGGICAFTVAWERPDAFRKVVSHIGSFTSIAYRPATADKPLRPGGELYPALIRKNPIKPLRVFLQDGSQDLDNEHGHWFLSNQQMLAAFNYANRVADEKKVEGPRYDVKNVWGEGSHSPWHGGAIFPDTMRWLWRDYKAKP